MYRGLFLIPVAVLSGCTALVSPKTLDAPMAESPNIRFERNFGWHGVEPEVGQCLSKISVDGKQMVLLKPDEIVTIKLGQGLHKIEATPGHDATGKANCPNFAASRYYKVYFSSTITVQVHRQ